MNYIPADKLIAEIKRLQQHNDTSEDKDYPQYELDVASGYDMACEDILELIGLLQQEQPDGEEDGGKFVKISVRKEFAEQLQKLGDEIQSGQSSFVRATNQQEQPELPGIEESGIPGKDYIPVEWVDACEKYGKWKIVKQEQPEVELNEETIINEFRVIRDKCFNEGIEGWQREKLIARHFYELGKNAKK